MLCNIHWPDDEILKPVHHIVKYGSEFIEILSLIIPNMYKYIEKKKLYIGTSFWAFLILFNFGSLRQQ